MEVLGDRLIHFELAASSSEKSSLAEPIPVTPSIEKTGFPGPRSFRRDGDAFETEALRVVVDSETLCVAATDKTTSETLTVVCPRGPAGDLKGLSFSRSDMMGAYGLGEQFTTPGSADGDWLGKIRTSPDPYGNVLFDFEGGMVGNAQFPILYAVGRRGRCYAALLDHAYKQTWNFQGDPWTMETKGEVLRWYLIAGADLPALRTQFMDLVGHPSVPPKKAFGLWVSEFGYRDWDELEGKLKTLRAARFPVDGFVLDVYWFGPFEGDSAANSFGRVDWDTARFPDAPGRIARLREREGIDLGVIEESYVSSLRPEYGLLKDKGYLVKTAAGEPVNFSTWWGRGSMIDWTNSKAAAYWHDLKRQPLVDAGIRLHWTDLGEPESYSDAAAYAGVPPLTGRSEAAVHNVYNFKWAESIAAGYARHGERRRPFILSRSGAPGIQRFGVAMWSGDIGSNLRSLAAHANAQLHMSLSGIDYFGSDVGGFHRDGLEGDVDDVYTHWLAYSSLFDVPVRPHTNNESKKNETAPDRIGDAPSNLANLRERYELSPYYYSLAHRAYRYGEPVFPPLVYYYQDDVNVWGVGEEKMIGRDLLAAAALRGGETARSVYLPAGTWVDTRTNDWIQSPGRWYSGVAEYQGKLLRLPLFARAGAIIPKMHVDEKTMNLSGKRTDGSTRDELIARVYVSTVESRFTVFEDDGETVDYRKGGVAETEISQRLLPGRASVVFAAARGSYEGAPRVRANVVELVTPGGAVTGVAWNGKPLARLEAGRFDEAASGWCPAGNNLTLAKSEPLSVSQSKAFVFSLDR